MSKKRFKTVDIAVIGIMTAILMVAKVALDFLPNIELVSFLMILYGICFGWRVFVVIPVFVVVQYALYPPGDWLILYTYVWWIPAICGVVFKKADNIWGWSIFSGLYGLFFGVFYALIYFVIGLRDGGMALGFSSAFGKWISGIPFDLLHCVGNFAVMLMLYKPVRKTFTRIKKSLYN